MKVYSIFKSIDGEYNAHGQGHTTTFVRLSGCNLNCNGCDTEYAKKLSDGKNMNPKQIMDQINKFGLGKVTITGGEPLMQQGEEFNHLMWSLYYSNTMVTIETNGSIFPKLVGAPSLIIDYKTPGSGMSDMMNQDIFFDYVTASDCVKFVIHNHDDYTFAKSKMIEIRNIRGRVNFAFSPAHDLLEPKKLIRWMLNDNLDAVFNIQMHKYLNLSEDK